MEVIRKRSPWRRRFQPKKKGIYIFGDKQYENSSVYMK